MKAKHTNNPGIDYGLGQVNRDSETGIRYGVIPANAVDYFWDEAEPVYPPPHCGHCGSEVSERDEDEDLRCTRCGEAWDPDDDMSEPVGWQIDTPELKAHCGSDGDVFVVYSKHTTYAQFCSPCAPGACYLLSPLEEPVAANECYCFGPDWFEDEQAPYPVTG